MIRMGFLLLAACFLANAFVLHTGRPLAHTSANNILIQQYHIKLWQRDVSVNLFGDFFKKLKGDKSKGNVDGDRELPDTPSYEKNTNTSFVNPFTVQSSREEAKTNQEESPESQAEKLRAQAARIRLEAEKRQVELTLEKISKLDDQLKKVRSKKGAHEKEQKDLEDALSVLKNQLVIGENGEMTFVPPTRTPLSSSNATKSPAREKNDYVSSVSQDERLNTVERLPEFPLSDEELKKIVQKFEGAPDFLKIMIARIVGFGVDDVSAKELNATDIISQLFTDEQQIELQTAFLKINMTDARDILERSYAKSNDMGPDIPQNLIDEKVEQLGNLPTFVKKAITGSTNDTEIAIDLLADEQKKSNKQRSTFNIFGNNNSNQTIGQDGERLNKEGGTFGRMFGEDESASGALMPRDDIGLLMESTFPASTRKEGQTPSEEEVNAFVNDVLGHNKAFSVEGNALPVPGGWIIRGKNECENGDELIDKLDRRIADVASLRDSISFFLIKDPFPPSQDDFIQDPLNWPQVIFVSGTDVAREPRPVIGTLISALGISTAWYSSIYPFLANTALFERAEEAMSLSDAGMPADLSWLSDESIPLFFSFMALQLVHEMGHIAIAKSKNFEVTVPTFIPSVISGITSSVTSLKTSPKNKSDLLLFSVAGPLTGIIASLLLELYGLGLTASADLQSLQSFPGLPLALLRQSSLGGGIVDLILGNGVLNVPASIEGTNMLASTIIPLHPFAIAGFVSLLVNALALVPAGRSDGGRISMSLFGRSGSQGLTLLSLASLFVVGFSGSDLMLFYFGFLVLSQLELEIPLRNEVDDVGLPEVLLALLAGFLMVLTIVPM